MSLEVLTPLTHSRGGKRYHLKEGDILPDGFFEPRDREAFLERDPPLIKKVNDSPATVPEGKKQPVLTDLSKMKIPAAKGLLETEYEVVNLEKYWDQENSNKRRKSILNWIDLKIRDLTGFEPARVR